MPITGPSSYIDEVPQFIAHWQSVDGALAVPLTLQGGVGIAELEARFAALSAQYFGVQQLLQDREMARANISEGSAGLCRRMEQFNARVRVLYAGMPLAEALARVPNVLGGKEKVLGPLEDTLLLWQKADADGGPLVLVGDYGVGDFSNDLAALKSFYGEYQTAVLEAKLARAERNATQAVVFQMLKQYRATVPTHFEAGSAYISSLPRLSPLPGHTPEPVAAQAGWDAEAREAKVTWEPSEDKTLDRYQLRSCPGPDYDETDARVVKTVPGDAPRELVTQQGLSQPGSTVTYKLFVILSTGNERGSAPMTVVRPPG